MGGVLDFLALLGDFSFFGDFRLDFRSTDLRSGDLRLEFFLFGDFRLDPFLSDDLRFDLRPDLDFDRGDRDRDFLRERDFESFRDFDSRRFGDNLKII